MYVRSYVLIVLVRSTCMYLYVVIYITTCNVHNDVSYVDYG